MVFVSKSCVVYKQTIYSESEYLENVPLQLFGCNTFLKLIKNVWSNILWRSGTSNSIWFLSGAQLSKYWDREENVEAIEKEIGIDQNRIKPKQKLKKQGRHPANSCEKS